jgi:1-acyl-sn-glycerol-3-phosphate acyltransferase
MEKKRITLQERFAGRRLHPPPYILYRILAWVVKTLFYKKLGVNIRYRVNLRDYPSSYIVVSNHASRLDYIYVTLAFLPHSLNYVGGYNEFFRSHLAGIFRWMQVIPKKNFVSDPYTIREMKRVLARGGRVALFPEGMSSISGANQPCMTATGKLLKHCGLPVLLIKIAGGYLTSPKFSTLERPGRVDIVVDSLFTPEDLANMSAGEIQRKVDQAIAHDDYQWNKETRISYDGKGEMAHNLHTLLYWCPKCHREFTMRGEGSRIICSSCGNGAVMNEYYDLIPLDETCVIPDTPRVWFDMERQNVRAWIRRGDFEMREKVKLGTLPKYRYLKKQDTSEISGAGEILLNREGFHFTGENDGAPFSFSLRPENLPTYGMCTDVTRFYTFYDNRFFEFFPEGETTAKWLLAAEENHRMAGGQWRDFPGRESADVEPETVKQE